MIGVSEIAMAPLLPWWLLAGFAVLAFALTLFGVMRGARGSLLRGAAMALALVTLANPRHAVEQRESQTDVGVIVVDRSPSQEVGERRALTDAAIAKIKAQVAEDSSLELNIVEAGFFSGAAEGPSEGGTRLLAPALRRIADVPASRYAGTVLITDGQVHDVEDVDVSAFPDGPVHVLVTGERDSYDRRIAVDQVPAYAIVGKPFDLAFRVFEDGPGASSGATRTVELRVDGEVREKTAVVPGESGSFSLELDRTGSSIIEIEVDGAENELATINNVATATVNGIRDRLRVLLVSGQPHAGERTWRNLLKSDPSVDLVHFTILRPPDKSDFTPIRELALITFPTFELFELKLQEFDLIVFDRYVVRFVLSPLYFRNIRDYVTRGGAVMLAVGPEFAGQRSLYDTPLGEISPARPIGGVIEQAFRPSLTDTGKRHPVTAGLSQSTGNVPGDDIGWGRWLRQIEVHHSSGDVLMRGVEDLPLLILDRVGKGRIGLLASDQIWLWARDFDGGGPHAELVRRTAHWLMREPSLEEEKLTAHVEPGHIRVVRTTLAEAVGPVTVTYPNGGTAQFDLTRGDDDNLQAVIEAEGPGVYRFQNDELTAHAVVGEIDPIEYRDLRATDDKLGYLATASGGGIHWLVDGAPDVRRTRPDRDATGRDWFGLRANGSYIVTGLIERPLMPTWLAGILVVLLLIGAWWRESRPLR